MFFDKLVVTDTRARLQVFRGGQLKDYVCAQAFGAVSLYAPIDRFIMWG